MKLKAIFGALAAMFLSGSAIAQDSQNIDLQNLLTRNLVTQYFCTVKNGRDGFKIMYRNAAYPFVSFNDTPALDWHNWDALLVDVTNLESRFLKVLGRVDDDVNADGWLHCKTAWVTINKNQTVTVAFPLRVNPMSVGMRALPPIPGTVWMADNRQPVDLTHVVSWRLFLEFPNANANVMIKNPRLVRANTLTQSFIDEFGQYNRDEWPGKVHSVAELVSKDQQEAAELAAYESGSSANDQEGQMRDEYGGWADGPQFQATGRFRTTFYNGKWWFVDPNGFLFLSYGMNSIDFVDITTVVTQREYMFSWLPQPNDPLYEHYSAISGVFAGPVHDGLAYNFYGANLQRKYGDDYVNMNHMRTVERLKYWGFNTIGAFSNQAMWSMRNRIPYTAFCKIYGNHHKVTLAPGYTLHDPFDAQFQTDCTDAISPVAATAAHDPYCLGWFIDNELLWTPGGAGEEAGRYGIAYGTLNEATSASAAKQVFIADLKAKYGTIGALNTAWARSFASWAAMDAPINLTDSSTAARKTDFIAFITKYANKYFSIVKNTLNGFDSSALYLGSRFYLCTKEVQDSCANYADVLTFNIYGYVLPGKYFYPDIAYLHKPFMVGEFHFGATDRGMFHPGLAVAFNQADRARCYTNYVQSILENKAFIGCHWFQYTDQPLAGRMYDGENFANGFVSVADVPYSELIGAAAAVHQIGYDYRYYR